MASVAGSAVSAKPSPRFASRNKAVTAYGLKSVSFAGQRKSLSLRPAPLRFQVSCAAKQETVEKVAAIVKKQLALSDDKVVVGESKFSELGADSLDTVEIVMGIEEAFDVSVEEENAQSIATVQDAADMIEKLVEAKCN